MNFEKILIKFININPLIFLILISIVYRLTLLPIYIIRYKNYYLNNVLKKYIEKYNINKKIHNTSIKKIRKDVGVKKPFFMFILFILEVVTIYSLFNILDLIKNKNFYLLSININNIKNIIYITYILVMLFYEYIYYKYKIKHNFIMKKQLKFEICLSMIFLLIIFYFAKNYKTYLLIYFINSYILFIIIKKVILEVMVFKQLSFFNENFISTNFHN